MRKWARRLGYFIFLCLWLLLISLPFLAFTLSARQQFEFGDPAQAYARVFLLQEKVNEGLGLEIARPSPDNPSCRQTTVRYFMWVGQGEDVTFCQCLDTTGRQLSATTGPCAAPSLD